MLTLNLAVRPPTLAVLAVRPPGQFYVVYCSASRLCSSTLPCGEELAPRFRWDTL